MGGAVVVAKLAASLDGFVGDYLEVFRAASS